MKKTIVFSLLIFSLLIAYSQALHVFEKGKDKPVLLLHEEIDSITTLVKDSNPEIGDNVVLEINASPGTAGISDVLKENFINILLRYKKSTTQQKQL
jgi:hypothetical protein